jgi:hypothetical protein
VTSDIGAIEFVRWHASHFSWKIGAMSFVKVGFAGASAAAAVAAAPTVNAAATVAIPKALVNPVIAELLFAQHHEKIASEI